MFMPSSAIQVRIPISIFKEDKRFVAYSHVLDLSSSGKTAKEAERRYAEAVQLFFDEIIKQGTLKQVLSELGWRKVRNAWQPPELVSHKTEKMKVLA